MEREEKKKKREEEAQKRIAEREKKKRDREERIKKKLEEKENKGNNKGKRRADEGSSSTNGTKRLLEARERSPRPCARKFGADDGVDDNQCCVCFGTLI